MVNLLKLLISVMLMFFVSVVFSQQITSSTWIKSYTVSELKALINQSPDNDIKFGVNLYKILYTTKNLQGNETTVSGLIVIPQTQDGKNKFNIVVYQHGTSNDREDVPSRLKGDWIIGAAFGGAGYVTLMSDYLGLGDNPGYHPFIHAASETWVAADLFKAFIKSSENLYNVKILSDYFVAGYSQGGHASMALHRWLQSNPIEGYNVLAAAHSSGIYAVSQSIIGGLTSNNPVTNVSFLPHTFLGYKEPYKLFNNINEVFKSPYDVLIQNRYEEKVSLIGLNTNLLQALILNQKILARDMLASGLYTNLTTNPNHPINLALKDNDVFAWKPLIPTRLYYCSSDEIVPSINSTIAESTMKSLGATDVSAVNLSSQKNHVVCGYVAIASTVSFFNAELAKKGISVPKLNTLEVVDITTNKVKSGGLIVNDGGDEITSSGLVYGLDSLLNLRYTKSFNDTLKLKRFNLEISDLQSNTTYFIRAFAKNSRGVGYGNVIKFTTPPVVTDFLHYEFVARDRKGDALSNQNVAVQVDIMPYLKDANAVYQERFNVNTDLNGKAIINIGSGSKFNANTANFSAIRWDTASNYLKISVDLNGGSNYVLQSVQNLLGVPTAHISKWTKSVPLGTLRSEHLNGKILTYDMFAGNPSSSEPENGAQKDASKVLLTKEDLDGVKKTITSLINPEKIIDGDGNPYTPIIIGGQMWLTENLKTTKYMDGTPIIGITDSAQWVNTTAPAWSYYNNDVGNNQKLGKLYNGYAVSQDESRGLCPTGWHVPSSREWSTLADHFENLSIAAQQLKSTSGWTNLYENGTNLSGFGALPGGQRRSIFVANTSAYWWTSTKISDSRAYYASLYNWASPMNKGVFNYHISYGLSIRCIKNGSSNSPKVLRKNLITNAKDNWTIHGEIEDSGGGIISETGLVIGKERADLFSILPNDGDYIPSKNLSGSNFSVQVPKLTSGRFYWLGVYAKSVLGKNVSDYILIKTSLTSSPANVKDIEGNEYRTITIGNQTWLKDNLITTKFNDGTSLQWAGNNNDWVSSEATATPSFNYLYNSIENKYTYGVFYNYHAIKTDKLCPLGWRIPKESDWKSLINYYNGNAEVELLKQDNGFSGIPTGFIDPFNTSYADGSYYWISDLSKRRYTDFYGVNDYESSYFGEGLNVRCIKN